MLGNINTPRKCKYFGMVSQCKSVIKVTLEEIWLSPMTKVHIPSEIKTGQKQYPLYPGHSTMARDILTDTISTNVDLSSV